MGGAWLSPRPQGPGPAPAAPRTLVTPLTSVSTHAGPALVSWLHPRVLALPTKATPSSPRPHPGPAPEPAHLPPTDSSLLQDNVAFVLCLDTLGRGSSLHLHVSKPPREGTLQHAFLRELQTVGAGRGGVPGGALAPDL